MGILTFFVCGLFVVENVFGMRGVPARDKQYLPQIAFSDRKELANLSKYHASLTTWRTEAEYFLPSTLTELKELCSFWRRNASDCENEGCDLCKRIWKCVLHGVHMEFLTRCKDGDVYFVDEYVRRFSKFVEVADKFEHYEFLKPTYKKEKESSLMPIVYIFFNLMGEHSVHPDMMTHLMKSIDEILTSSRMYKDANVWKIYNALYLNDYWKQSAAYNAMFRMTAKNFENGVSLESEYIPSSLTIANC
ncbi:MAG: hypothetical protein LBQ43_03465 [Holosporales bacterium]|jgi:hypothetical protein|nr:hypothetical protein [Holosporales bacterium]